MSHQVLARKYRPSKFSELIGQDFLVKVVGNAIAQNRVPNAYLLTGIRGVGKTTTARIIAKSLNCEQGANIDPCGICSNCISIAKSSHPDILELDAASRTGVGDIREIIDNISYMPISARYKIYIIDEVHMLSNSAFNALLKTLEEPPPHAKFIFATTEVRKIPVTIISRCQRFDLKRVSKDELALNLKIILDKEGKSAEDNAISLIADAAEGSVRDSLSMLDQAIAHGDITYQSVRDMLGLADRSQIFALFEHIINARMSESFKLIHDIYEAGADPVMIISDLMDVTYAISKAKFSREFLQSYNAPEFEIAKISDLSKQLTIPALTMLWQLMQKAFSEIKNSDSPLESLEMAAIRIAYASKIPDFVSNAITAPAPAPIIFKNKSIDNFEQLLDLFSDNPLYHAYLKESARIEELRDGYIKWQLDQGAPAGFRDNFRKELEEKTSRKWNISEASDNNNMTLNEQRDKLLEEEKNAVAKTQEVATILQNFEGAKILKVE